MRGRRIPADCSRARGEGGLAAFDEQWQQALEGREPRWFSYPAEHPTTQTEIFELVKAKRIEKMLADHGLRAGEVLEFGCGAAGMAIFLANRGFQVCAADISENALKVARINASLHGSPSNLTLVRGDVFQLPFGDGTFDVTMSHGLLEHFDEERSVGLIEEVLRVLRPGGLFVSDIVPGPRRLSVRTIGLGISYLASLAYHLVRGKAAKARGLYADYFRSHYENSLSDQEWGRILHNAGLEQVSVDVCRPFPPLALSGHCERAYVRLMRAGLPLWERFDGRNSWFSRRWGWMYLAHGAKP